MPLFRRDADGAHLTAAGERLLPALQQMARWANELERAAADVDNEPAGVVRITTMPNLAHEFFVPFARDLRERLPEIRLEILSGLETIDLSRGHAEIAIRSRRPTQPDLACVARIVVRLGVFASKAYAERLKPPLIPADLDWITWSAPLEHLTPRPELEALIPDFRPSFASNDHVVQRRAVAEGLGVMILPAIRYPDEPYAPLVEVPLELPLPEGELFVVCAKTMRRVSRVASVLEFLFERLRAVEGVRLEIFED